MIAVLLKVGGGARLICTQDIPRLLQLLLFRAQRLWPSLIEHDGT